MSAGQAAGACAVSLDDEEGQPPLTYIATPLDIMSSIGNRTGYRVDDVMMTYRFAFHRPRSIALVPFDFRPMWLAFRHDDGAEYIVPYVDQVRVGDRLTLEFRRVDIRRVTPTMSRGVMVLGINHAVARFYRGRRLDCGESIPSFLDHVTQLRDR